MKSRFWQKAMLAPFVVGFYLVVTVVGAIEWFFEKLQSQKAKEDLALELRHGVLNIGEYTSAWGTRNAFVQMLKDAWENGPQRKRYSLPLRGDLQALAAASTCDCFICRQGGPSFFGLGKVRG